MLQEIGKNTLIDVLGLFVFPSFRYSSKYSRKFTEPSMEPPGWLVAIYLALRVYQRNAWNRRSFPDLTEIASFDSLWIQWNSLYAPSRPCFNLTGFTWVQSKYEIFKPVGGFVDDRYCDGDARRTWNWSSEVYNYFCRSPSQLNV